MLMVFKEFKEVLYKHLHELYETRKQLKSEKAQKATWSTKKSIEYESLIQ